MFYTRRKRSRSFHALRARQALPLRILLLVASFAVMLPVQAFMDDEGCLLCHKYPKMGRITDEGARRSYYVLPQVFSRTVHRNVPCRDCHNYIQELPHKPVTTGVTCNQECHSVENPATGKNFSHQRVYEYYKESIHGRAKIVEGADNDKPYCITCHTNPLYNPGEEVPPAAVTDRCVICHEDYTFVKTWYNHTARRIRQVRRTSQQIVELCSSCHGDPSMVARRLKLAKEEGRELGPKFKNAVATYDKSFHGKVTRYGFKLAANCLDCHADYKDYYLSVHDIRPSSDPKSPVYKSHRFETCKRCHKNATQNYSGIDPHPPLEANENPTLHVVEEFYNWIGNSVIFALIGLALFETWGRRRDGAQWQIRRGSTWWRRSKRGRDRIVR